jgi:CP family cyanate transporter-like MFS transporter
MPATTPATPTATSQTLTSAVGATRLAVTIFLVALNLRAALAALPPLVSTIQRDLSLSGAEAGLLTTLPVLCMGLFAPVATVAARRVGREATVAAALVLMLAGQLMRLAGGVLAVLLLSTLLVGVGIALAGTVLPGIVKEHFAGRSGMMTGVYLLAMMVGAATSSALAVPLADALGSWQRSLAVWSGLAVVGLAVWLPVVRRGRPRAPSADDAPHGPLPWRSRTTWLLASYLALQSFGFYSQIAWISPSFESLGWSARDAGLLLALWSISQFVTGVGAPALADRLRDRRPLIAGTVLCAIAGTAGLVLAPEAAPVLWVLLLAFGQGGGFALGLVKLVDYAPTPAASARLSGLVFLVSYSTASLGPFVFGALHDASGGFRSAWGFLLAVAVAQLLLVPRLRPGRLTEPHPPS